MRGIEHLPVQSEELTNHSLTPIDADFGAENGRAMWREAWRGLFDVDIVAPPNRSAEAGLSARANRRYVLSLAEHPDLLIRRDARVMKLGMCDAIAIRAVISGSVAGQSGGRDIRARRGDVLALDLAREVEIKASADVQANSRRT